MGIHKEGVTLITVFLAITVCCFILSQWKDVFGYISIIFIIISLLLVNFFRDPSRRTQQNEQLVYSPADGEIIEISRVQEDKFLKSEATVIKIFMTPLDVHIQRSPIKGLVLFQEYKAGKFLPAKMDKASTDNEQNLLGFEGKIKVLVKQIAGLLARRIVWWVHMQQGVSQGEKIGMIKFGSQVDIYVPLNVEIKVKLKDKVKAGLTIIGEVK
jgi:phosphatidylserine decarboxylase